MAVAPEVAVVGSITELLLQLLLFPDPEVQLVNTAAEAGARDVDSAPGTQRPLLEVAEAAAAGTGSTAVDSFEADFGPSFFSDRSCFNLVIFFSFCKRHHNQVEFRFIYRQSL